MLRNHRFSELPDPPAVGKGVLILGHLSNSVYKLFVMQRDVCLQSQNTRARDVALSTIHF